MKKSKLLNESIMSDNVKRALGGGRMTLSDGSKLKCDVAIREFSFKGCKYDVIGYNIDEKSVYIVECKLGNKIANIGHAFGQIMAYTSLIEENGNKFLNEFASEVIKKSKCKIGFYDMAKSFNKEFIRFRFFVALTKEACRRYKEIRPIKDGFKFKIGIIRVNEEGRCNSFIMTEKNKKDHKICESEPVLVNLKRKYNRNEFFDEVIENLSEQAKKIKKFSFKYRIEGNNLQVPYRSLHFEIRDLSSKEMEIALHIEKKRKLTNEYLKYFKNKKRKIRNKLGKVKVEKWGNHWCRIYTKIPYTTMDNELIDEVASKLIKFIKTLKPLVDEFKSKKKKK